MQDKRNDRLKYLIKISVLSAMSFILMLFEFPLTFVAPAFYQLDFSEVTVLIGSFALGPLAGVLIELFKNLLHILIMGTSTAYIGELANFLTGCAFILPASLFYRHRKTLGGAVGGLVLGVITLVTFGGFFNYFFLIEAFSSLYGLPLGAIVEMGAAINPAIDGLLSLVLFCTVPFNMLKGILCAAITMLLYKRLSPLLHR